MTSDDSTPPPLPSASGPRKRFLGGSPPGVRTAGEIAADSERSGAAAEGSAADEASSPPAETAAPARADQPSAPAEDSKAAKKAEKQAARDERKTARAEKKAAKAEDSKDGTDKDAKSAKGTKDPKAAKEKKPATQTVRTRAAALIWTVAVVCALVLAVGALLVALQANQDNAAVGFVLGAADGLDLGIFSRENGIFEFDGASAEVRNALVNWGLGAVAYLVVGKVLDRLVHP